MEYEELFELKKCLALLIEEKDAKTGLAVEDTILKSSFNKKVLLDAVHIIDQLLKLDFNPTKTDKRKKYAFYIAQENRDSIVLSKEPISISNFAYLLNEYIDITTMKKIRATEMTKWLTDLGYLHEIEHPDGKTFKEATEKGQQIGIIPIEKESEYGRKYHVNLYTEQAQRFILNNLDNIINSRIELL